MNKAAWIKIISTYKKKCDLIISLSKDIRYAGVFNEYGRTIAGKIRPGLKPIFSPNSVREEFFAVASIIRLRQKTAKGLGELEYILINHKKVNILLFSHNNITYYITVSSNVIPTSTLITKIKKIIAQR
jgi:hypothetical protein